MAGFAVNTSKGQVALVDLPLRAFDPIVRETGMDWIDLINHPAQTPLAAVMLYEAACAHVGAPAEELSAGRLIEGTGDPIFVLADADMPVAWDPETALPNSEGGQVMTGSSGAPAPSDGLPPSPAV